MSVTVTSATLVGVEALPITVEVDLLRRLPRIAIVGLPANAVQDTAERVRSAIAASSEEFPRSRIVVNLAPADVRKEGTALDLPIALGILAASLTDTVGAPGAQINPEALAPYLFVGELSLSGELRNVRGVLAYADLAKKMGKKLILPVSQAAQAALVPGVVVYGARSLSDVIAHLRGDFIDDPSLGQRFTLDRAFASESTSRSDTVDLREVRGQSVAKRALEIAAAGGHSLLLVGPPGSGKSMLARRLTTILPLLTRDEALETARVQSAAGLLGESSELPARPFRAPHHTVTVAGLVGDRRLRPGEVSLAHNGVLFLDEAPEFPRATLESLRTPLADGKLQLVRAEGNVNLPSRALLVLAMNACPCGRNGSTSPCSCSYAEITKYQKRLEPISSRIDLRVTLEHTPSADLIGSASADEDSATVRARVVAARTFATARGKPFHENDLTFDCDPRARRIARTIADLAGSERIEVRHATEALALVGGV